MGFVYHANYLVWLDMARTEHLRRTGVTYKEMEAEGVFLAVTEARIRYRQPARYDDLVRIRCWVRDLASRRVIFGYAVERAATDELLATAETALIALDRRHGLTRIPAHVMERLHATADPAPVRF
jgi:acyl-CoA thioester hydrolase